MQRIAESPYLKVFWQQLSDEDHDKTQVSQCGPYLLEESSKEPHVVVDAPTEWESLII
jgi:hypothetical protein